MRRRRAEQCEEHGNTERWLVSYADFITLLFAFFVVMYAISSVNEGKYRVLTDSLTSVFHQIPRSDEPIQVGELGRTLQIVDNLTPPDEGGGTDRLARLDEQQYEQLKQIQSMSELSRQLADTLRPYEESGQLSVISGDGRVEVRINSKMLFGSGSAALSGDALRVLNEVADILQLTRNLIHVEGHTDNIPISTREFPSNWELSAARAASVVHFLSQQGLAPARLAAVGYGEFQPLVPNDSEQGRARNRRVSLVILPKEAANEAAAEDVPWAEGPAFAPPAPAGADGSGTGVKQVTE